MFQTTHWITQLTIESSALDFIPDFGYFDFISFEKLTITDCPYISCSDITKLKEQRSNLEIIFDGNCYKTTTAVVSTLQDTTEKGTNKQTSVLSTYALKDSTTYMERATESTYQHTDVMLISTSSALEENRAGVQDGYTTNSEKRINVAKISIIISCVTLFIILVIVVSVYIKLKLKNRNQVAQSPVWLELDRLSVNTTQTNC